jgi:hypothetical protein
MAGGLLELFPPEAVLSCPRDAKDNQQMMQRIALIAVCSTCRITCSSSLSSVGYTIHQDHESHATAIRKNPPSFYASAREIILLHGFLVVKFFDRSLHGCVAFACLRDGVLNLRCGDTNGPLKALIPFPRPLFNQENYVPIQFQAVEM